MATPVTLALLAFNQEEFVEEAVRSVLEQRHSPLEIILSDDCSSDRTFAIIERLAADYRGPHRLILNRNATNLGLAGHINRIADIAGTDIIVLAAGDDVSLPRRVERIVAEFDRDPSIFAVLSGHREIDSSGTAIRDNVLPSDFAAFTRLPAIAGHGGWVAMGATFAYRRQCFTTPAAIPDEILCEDGILPFRAAMLGKVAFIREPLVDYRIRDGSATREARFLAPDYLARAQQILQSELAWGHRSGLIDSRTYRQSLRNLSGYARYIARSKRLGGSPLMKRLHDRWHGRIVWLERARIRLAALFR